MTELANQLREKNLKITPQRLAIYSLLYNTNTHPCAETIYTELKKDFPMMSLATVYKTLDTLKKSGFIQEINLGEDSFRYDATVKPHSHFLCSECNNVYDMECEGILADFKEKIEEEKGFEFEKEQIYFFGKCNECTKKGN